MNYEIFSKRINPPHFDVYNFETLPYKLRVQIFYSWKKFFVIDKYMPYTDNVQFQIFDFIEETMCREHGLLTLSHAMGPLEKCKIFLLEEKDILKVIDLIELSVKIFKFFEESYSYHLKRADITQSYRDLVDEVNNRFKENGIGYEIIGEHFIRKDEEFVYENATKPALALLKEVEFTGAEEEFFDAYDHFKNGKNKEAIASASKSFESTLKSICARKEWVVVGKGNASSLINCVLTNELIPKYMQTQLTSLKTTLEGLPTLRNNNGGHGQGEKTNDVPDYLASYALNLCASNIVFLVNAYKNNK